MHQPTWVKFSKISFPQNLHVEFVATQQNQNQDDKTKDSNYNGHDSGDLIKLMILLHRDVVLEFQIERCALSCELIDSEVAGLNISKHEVFSKYCIKSCKERD